MAIEDDIILLMGTISMMAVTLSRVYDQLNLTSSSVSMITTSISSIEDSVDILDTRIIDIFEVVDNITVEADKIQTIDDNIDNLLAGETYTWAELNLRNKHYRIFNAVYSGRALISGTLKTYSNEDDRTANTNPTHTYTFVNERFTEI